MAGKRPIFKTDGPKILAALEDFSLRDRALFVTGMNTGFRITELLSLDVGQVWDAGKVKLEVRVARAQLKGGQGPKRRAVKSRVVPLNVAATAALEQYLFARFGSGPADPQAPLFLSSRLAGRLSRWQANRIVHAVIEKAGLGSPESYGTHTLRKSFCRRIYLATGHDINLTRAVMGHASVSTTQQYLYVADEEVQAAVKAIGVAPNRNDGHESATPFSHYSAQRNGGYRKSGQWYGRLSDYKFNIASPCSTGVGIDRTDHADPAQQRPATESGIVWNQVRRF
jgi:integrase